MKKRNLFIAVSMLTTMTGVSIEAHHANSLYDGSTNITISGTVSKWQFINPHAGLWLDVMNENEEIQEWSAEFQGTLDLYRHFKFNKDTFKSGDEITLIGHPARTGGPTISTLIVVFADGTEVNVRSAPD
jgi:hypothetical protein|tara:strand:+ start:835 stop:1224 length:390 start_codon:yes stop_codon:yes gene_type:complete